MIYIKYIKKSIKFFICYILIFVCFFLSFSLSKKTYSVQVLEQPQVQDIPEISDAPESFDEPDISEPLNSDNLTNLNNLDNNPVEQTEKITIISDSDDPEEPEAIMYYKKKHMREIVFTAVGDLTLGSNYVKPYSGSFYELYDLYGPEYFCENVAPVFHESDCTIANLECALTDNQDPGIRQGKTYCYKGYTEYTSILTAAGIDVVNLANNHSYDYSQEGYDDTIKALDGAGIGYFGNGTVLIKEINGIQIGFIGIIGAYRSGEVKPAIDYLNRNGAEIIIASFHWGNMDERIANSTQVEAARYAIDCGADLVIGHHPHVLQGIEIYKDKYILYSLGNFIFDGNVISDIENRTSIIFRQKFVLYGTDIITSSADIIPILVTSNMSRNNFKPILAEGVQKEAILQKVEARSVH